MSEKYYRYNSNYILRKKHQNIKNGTIYERDWVTIGALHKFEKGKTPIYYDGNFLFTTSSVKGLNKKQKYNSSEEEFTYKDLQDTNKKSSYIISNDIRSYAYYGSSVELIRTTIENIIKNFPVELRVSNQIATLKETSDSNEQDFLVISNPFNIDLHHEHVLNDDNVNLMRFLSYSYDKYYVNDELINDYKIKKYFKEGEDINCLYNTHCLYSITLNNKFIIYIYLFDNTFLYVTNTDNTKVINITPIEEEINKYFENLEGFEAILLNKTSKPLYTAELLTPIETNIDYKYVNRLYTWPNNGYCIDIETPAYYEYVSNLMNLGKIYDMLWTDNLYRSMTHEAIKNYDWTYSREYEPGEEQDNIDGGERVEKLLRIYGRCFDDIKQKIDTIKNKNTVTYDNYNNTEYEDILQQLSCSGWDIVSLIGNLDTKYKYVDNDIYSGYDMTGLTASDLEKEMFRRFILSGGYMQYSKGTRHSIIMLLSFFGLKDSEYDITEEFYKTSPIKDDYIITNIKNINNNKQTALIYDDDEFSGIPLKIINYNGNNVLVPFLDNNKFYDGDIYYHCNGGWGYTNTNGSLLFPYLETIPYLYTVKTYNSLFDINIHSLKDNDIYYVESIDDYDGKNDNTSNYFISKFLNDEWTWENISKTDELYNYAEYLYNIVGSDFGNNPHVGYGKYDNGNEYILSLSNPFYQDNKLGYTTGQTNNYFTLTRISNNVFDNKIINSTEIEEYILNSKVVNITFSFTDFKEEMISYTKNVIIPYLLQLIPSTTILQINYI